MSEFTLDDRPIPFTPGQTLGAALMAAGVLSWRTTRIDHAPRGLFCGIGICYDCRLTVDGVPDQRACLVGARDGMTARTDQPSPDGRHEQ